MTCPSSCPLCAELEAFRQKACVRKQPYGERVAREIAEDLNRKQGRRVYQGYRCVFRSDHFHVGHVLGWSAVEHLAALIRHRRYPDLHPKENVA